MKVQKGFTIVELITAIVAIALIGGVLIVAIHFIHKFW